jgi:hypothetical protein
VDITVHGKKSSLINSPTPFLRRIIPIAPTRPNVDWMCTLQLAIMSTSKPQWNEYRLSKLAKMHGVHGLAVGMDRTGSVRQFEMQFWGEPFLPALESTSLIISSAAGSFFYLVSCHALPRP